MLPFRVADEEETAGFVAADVDQESAVRVMMSGLAGWLRMESGRSEAVQLTDTALTVVATLLAAVTWAMLR